MPLFGSSFPFDDKERRRRLALTPGINPDAPLPAGLPGISLPPRMPLRTPPLMPSRMPGAPSPSPLPETAVPTAMPLSAAGAPGPMPGPNPNAGVVSPTLPGQSRSQQLQGAREAHMLGTPGRGKSALTGALEALSRGEGLIGGVAGGLTGAISPRRLREQQFNQRVRPQILENFALEDVDAAQRMAAERAQREGRLAQAQISNIESEIGARTASQNLPMIIPQGATAIDKRTGKVITANEREAQPHWEKTTEGIQNLNAPENKGKTFQPYRQPAEPPPQVMTQLQQLKKAATTAWALHSQTPEGPDKELARQKAQAALDAYNNAVEQFGLNYGATFETGPGKGDWSYYKRRGASAQGAGAKPQTQQGGANVTRSRSQFNSQKFPGLKFD